MKKITLLLAACAFATASFAQTAPAKTEVKVRDNGTKKITTTKGDSKTVTTTGKTNVGKALENTADAAGNVAKKAGKGIKKTAKKVSGSAKKGSAKMEAKSENKM